MNSDTLFRQYEDLAAEADQAFQKVTADFFAENRCSLHCSDCCHALFGLFLIEAAYIKRHFDRLDKKTRQAARLRGQKGQEAIERLEEKLKGQAAGREAPNEILAKQRIRCPLLDDKKECILYPHRPITCRVYGIPTAIHGKARVCGKAGFKDGQAYPTFDLDGVYRKLYQLSGEWLACVGRGDPDQAALLVSVPKVIAMRTEDLIAEMSPLSVTV